MGPCHPQEQVFIIPFIIAQDDSRGAKSPPQCKIWGQLEADQNKKEISQTRRGDVQQSSDGCTCHPSSSNGDGNRSKQANGTRTRASAQLGTLCLLFSVIFFLPFNSSSSQARKIVESHPYVPMAARKLAAEKALAKRMVRDLLSQLTFISKPSQAGGDLVLQENLKLTNARVEELNHRLSHMSAGAASDCIAVPLTATPPSPPLPSEQVPAPNEQPVQRHPATSVPQISTFSSSAPTRTIILGDGTELTFTEADVGSPPLTSFADDVAGLNSMWDDTTPNWGGMSVLEIKGHPIPIVYWKDVYMNSNRGFPWKPRQWHGMKSKWFNWKVSFFFLGLLMLFCLKVNFTGCCASLPPRNAHQLLGRVFT